MQCRRAFPPLAAVLLLSAQAGLSSVLAQTQTPPSVTFQVEVNYVDVDAIVTDEQGRFVPGLTRDDFEVFEDGKQQNIDMFSYVELPVERRDQFAVLGRPVSTDTRSNLRPFDGRVYVLVLDDLDISPLRTAIVKKSAREFIERFFGANDLASVVYTSGRPDATQDFTSDRGLLLAAIDRFVGRRLQSAAIEALERHYQREFSRLDRRENEVDASAGVTDTASPISVVDLQREQRAVAVLDTLRNLGEFLAGVRGRRKAVLLFSEGLEMPISEIYSLHTPTDVGSAIRDAITAAARSNVNFFALDPRGLIGVTTEFIELAGSGAPDVAMGVFGSRNAQQGLLNDIKLSQDSLRTLAEETGGFATVNQNMLTTAFQRIVDANSRYYVLGYYPPASARDGSFHKIEVRAKRTGLRVSARRGYASPRSRTASDRKRDDETRRAREARRGAVNNTSPELRDALNAPLQQSGLTFTVHAAPFKHAQREASIALSIEFGSEALPFTPPDSSGLATNTLELSFFGINQDGKAQRSTRSQLGLTLRADSFKRVRTGGLRVNPRLVLEPGRYQIRVGARESVGSRVGTVFYDLVVPDFRKEPLMLSGVLVTAASAQAAMTAMSDQAAPELLPGPATSRRTFAQNDTLTVFAEIYDNNPAKQPRRIETAVTLTSERGEEVFGARDTVQNPGSTGYWTAHALMRDIPLTGVASGRYLLKVEAKALGVANPVARETLITIQ